MDVRCSRCGIEYEFDDTKLTAGGVTVKCTSCGHVFKVKPGDDIAVTLPPASAESVSGDWTIRRADGSEIKLRDLTTLQKWIVERKVARSDQISRTGRSWMPLGEVTELASFFQVVEAADAAGRSSVPPSTTPGERAPLSLPAAAGAAFFGDVDLSLDSGARPLNDGGVVLEAGDPVLDWSRARRRRMRALVAATLGVVVLVVVVIVWQGRPVDVGTLDDALETELTAALREDSDARLEQARARLENLEKPGPSAAVWMARVLIAKASIAADEARLVRALVRRDPSAATREQGRAERLDTRTQELLAKAYSLITDARAQAPSFAALPISLAAYHLVRGAYVEEKAELEAASASLPTSGAPESARREIQALELLADAHQAQDAGTVEAQLDVARRLALVEDARVRMARATLLTLAAVEKREVVTVDEAGAALRALPSTDGRTGLLAALLSIARQPPPAAVDAGVALVLADAGAVPVSVAAVDAGPSTPAAPAPLTPAPATTAVASTSTPASPGIATPATAESYDTIMQRAERARLNEGNKQALALYQQAAKLRPEAPRPWLGVGWSALDLGRNNEAIAAFKKAVGLDDSLADARFGMAEALRFAGKKDEAVAAYQEYLRLDPNGRDASVAKNAIESLQ